MFEPAIKLLTKTATEMKKRKYTNKEIIAKLKWFHGDEFDKYPLADDFICSKEIKGPSKN